MKALCVPVLGIVGQVIFQCGYAFKPDTLHLSYCIDADHLWLVRLMYPIFLRNEGAKIDSSLPLPSHPPLLNTSPPSAFTLPFTPPPPTSTQSNHNSPPHPQRTPRLPPNLRILQWNAGSLSPSRRAELIVFLSGNQYDLIFLQETHLLATKKFQIPGYSTLHTDRTFGRQGPVSSATHNTGGGVLTLIHSDLAFSPVSVSSLSSQDPYSDYTCAKVLFSNHSPLQFCRRREISSVCHI